MSKIIIREKNFLPHLKCDVELDTQSGRGLVIVGENGIGKTTLLRWINNRLDSSTDRVYLEQKNEPPFYNRQLKEIKKILLTLKDPRLDVSDFESNWEDFGLNQKLDRYQMELSGGESQLLKICSLISLRTPYYLLDEISTSLDENKKIILSALIQKKIQLGAQVILIEHNLGWLPKIMDVNQIQVDQGKLIKGRAWSL